MSAILEEEEKDAVVFGHAGECNVHVNPLVDVTHSAWRDTVRRILARTVDLVAGIRDTLSGEHGAGRLRGTFRPRTFGEPMAEASGGAKEALDPLSTLNPRALVPLPGLDPLAGITALRGDA